MNIWIPKFKIIEPDKAIPCPVRVGGRLRLRSLAPNGINVRNDSGWFDNLILDSGLDRMGTSPSMATFCLVGLDNTPPAVTDTTLGSFVAASGGPFNVVNSTSAVEPYRCTRSFEYQFAQGAAEGNLAEVAISWTNSNDSLLSRALIQDSEGNPTTFPVGSDEFLNVAYEFSAFVPTADFVGSIDVSGNSHDVVMRASNANTDSQGWRMSTTAGGLLFAAGSVNSSAATVYDGAIGSITASPSGATSSSSGNSSATYVDGNYFRDLAYIWGLASGNLAGGISASKAIFGAGTTGGQMAFQCSYSPDIVKTNLEVLTLNFRESWARSA